MEDCEESRFRGETGSLALRGGVRGSTEHWGPRLASLGAPLHTAPGAPSNLGGLQA